MGPRRPREPARRGERRALTGAAPVPIDPDDWFELAAALLARLGEPLGPARDEVDDALVDLPRHEWTADARSRRRTDGQRAIAVETTVGRKDFEGVDRAAAARIEGLPGGAVLRLRGPGDLREWTLEPDDERVAAAWERLLAGDALRRGRLADDFDPPDAWKARARILDPDAVRLEGTRLVAPGDPDFGLAFEPRYGTYELLGPLPRAREVELPLGGLGVATPPGQPVLVGWPSIAGLTHALADLDVAGPGPDEATLRERREVAGWTVRLAQGRSWASGWRLLLALQREDGAGLLARLVLDWRAPLVLPGAAARWADVDAARLRGGLLGPRADVVAAADRLARLLEELAWRHPAALLRERVAGLQKSAERAAASFDGRPQVLVGSQRAHRRGDAPPA